MLCVHMVGLFLQYGSAVLKGFEQHKWGFDENYE